MHCHWLSDDQAISDQFADRLTRVGIGDFVDFVRVEPDLALPAADHGGGQTLLSSKVDPVVEVKSVEVPLKEIMMEDVMYPRSHLFRSWFSKTANSRGGNKARNVATYMLSLVRSN